MELRMHSHRWIPRQADMVVAAIAGFGAGGILMLAELAFCAAMGLDPWRAPRLIATLLMGNEVLQGSGYSLGVLTSALIVHYLLGMAFAMVLAAVIAPFRLDSSLGMVLMAGFLFGLLLYLFNFYLMTSVLPWFAELRGGYTLLGHVVFGMAAAFIYRILERPGRQA